MDKKKIITIISIVLTVLIIVVAAVLIIHKNISTTKNVSTAENMNTEEPMGFLDEEPDEDPALQEEPEEDSTATPSTNKTTNKTTKTSSIKYYIKVNNQANTVTIYTKDANGNFTVPVKAMVCSTGNASPHNVKYTLKGKWNWGALFGGVYGQYITQINGNILFHSVPYTKKGDPNSLEWWEYDKLGTTASAGCVRLTVADAQWIYYNCVAGTTVEFYSSSDPGPLGKPSAMKISSYEEYRGWDPTDPNSNNPWKNATISTPEPEPTLEPTSEPTPDATPSIKPTPTVVTTPTEKPTPSAEPTAETTPSQETPEETTTPDTSQSENTETTTTPSEITEI